MSTITTKRTRVTLGAGISLAAVAAIGWTVMQPASGSSEAAGGADQVTPTVVASVAPVTQSGASGCPAGSLPNLKIARYPTDATGGATTVVDAIQQLDPSVKADSVIQEPFGRQVGAPVWAEAGDQTYLVTELEDSTWFASTASLAGCGVVSDMLTGVSR